MVARLGGNGLVIVWDDAGIIPNRASVSHFNRKRDAGRGEAPRGIWAGCLVSRTPWAMVCCWIILRAVWVLRSPENGMDLETLLGHADQAMYQAKRKGGGRVCIFNWGLEGKKMGRL